MREHKMQAVTHITFTIIVGDERICNELEVNTVSVPDCLVVVDGDVITFPQVDAVPDLMFRINVSS